jgi:hypothetical protein
MNVASQQDIRELAYQLWKKDVESNKPEQPSNVYWDEAAFQLTPRTWVIRSGELSLEGEGPLAEVIDAALIHANHNSIYLSESMNVSSDCNRNHVIDTIPNLIRLGLMV